MSHEAPEKEETVTEKALGLIYDIHMFQAGGLGPTASFSEAVNQPEFKKADDLMQILKEAAVWDKRTVLE